MKTEGGASWQRSCPSCNQNLPLLSMQKGRTGGKDPSGSSMKWHVGKSKSDWEKRLCLLESSRERGFGQMPPPQHDEQTEGGRNAAGVK